MSENSPLYIMKDVTDTTDSVLLLAERATVENMVTQMNLTTSSNNYYMELHVPVEGE